MKALSVLGSRLFSLLRFKPDFTNQVWARLGLEHRIWPFAAVGADLLAQFTFGQPTWVSLGASAATPLMLWFAPRVLATAGGLLMTVQALGSMGLAWAAAPLLSSPSAPVVGLGLALTYGYQLWFLAALLKAILQYLQTHKVAIPD